MKNPLNARARDPWYLQILCFFMAWAIYSILAIGFPFFWIYVFHEETIERIKKEIKGIWAPQTPYSPIERRSHDTE